MSDVIDNLLNSELNGPSNKIIISVNEPNREMSHEGSVLFGVEGDHKAERIYFKMPRYIFMDKWVDLQSGKIKIFIKFKNAVHNTYIYECTDKPVSSNESGGDSPDMTVIDDGEGNLTLDFPANYSVVNNENGEVTISSGESNENPDDDPVVTPVEDEYITFSWLLDEKVAEAAGTVKFIVCVQNIGTDSNGAEVIKNEWHSTVFEGEILKGIPVTSKTPTIIGDPVTTAYQLTLTVNEAYIKMSNCETAVNEMKAIVEGVDGRISALEDLPGRLASMEGSVGSKADKTELSNFYTKTEMDNLLYENDSRFKFIDRVTLGLNKSLSLLNYLNQAYHEFMIVIRMEGDGEVDFGLASSDTNTSADISMKFTKSIGYVMIKMNRTNYGYRAWSTCNDANNKFIWETDEYENTGNCMYLKNNSSKATAAEMTIVIFGRQ